jgi:hypothetical protein
VSRGWAAAEEVLEAAWGEAYISLKSKGHRILELIKFP